MKRWIVQITIVEYGRTALVEADTPKQARQRARNADWEDCGEALHFKVTVVGKVEEDK